MILYYMYLPHGLDSLFEKMEVAVASQITWSDHVTIKPPELLHLRHRLYFRLSDTTT